MTQQPADDRCQHHVLLSCEVGQLHAGLADLVNQLLDRLGPNADVTIVHLRSPLLASTGSTAAEGAAGAADLVAVDALAARLHVKPATVRAWCAAGRIEKAKKIGRQWRVPIDAEPSAIGTTGARSAATASTTEEEPAYDARNLAAWRTK